CLRSVVVGHVPVQLLQVVDQVAQGALAEQVRHGLTIVPHANGDPDVVGRCVRIDVHIGEVVSVHASAIAALVVGQDGGDFDVAHGSLRSRRAGSSATGHHPA